MISRKTVFLLIIIVVEILILIYLVDIKISGKFIKIKPLIVDITKNMFKYESIDEKKTTLKYFYTLKPNEYYIFDDYLGPVIYSTNNDSLRERYNYSIEKPNDVFRIAIFGDSMVYGLYVNISDVYTEILEDKLNELNCSKKIEVINFGIPGYDLPYAVEYFKIKGKYYNPDVSIFFIIDNDIMFINEFFIPIDTEKRNVYFNNNISTDKDILETSQKAQEEAANEYFSIYGSNVTSDEWMNEFIKKPLNYLYEVNEKKSKVILFTYFLPTEYQYYIKNESEKNHFILFNLDDFDNDYRELWSEKFSAVPHGDNHPNKQGHEFLANHLYNFLSSN